MNKFIEDKVAQLVADIHCEFPANYQTSVVTNAITEILLRQFPLSVAGTTEAVKVLNAVRHNVTTKLIDSIAAK